MRSCGETEARGGLKPLSVANRVRVQVPPGALSLRTRTWNMDAAKDRGSEGSNPSGGIRPCTRTGIWTAFRVRGLRVRLPPWSLKGECRSRKTDPSQKRDIGGSTPLSPTYLKTKKGRKNYGVYRYDGDGKQHRKHFQTERRI